MDAVSLKNERTHAAGRDHLFDERERNGEVPAIGGDDERVRMINEEMVAASRVRPLAFLPDEFCGVLHHGNELAPIVDAGGKENEPAHVVLVRVREHLLGLKFYGMPLVVDLDETKHVPFEPGDENPTNGILPLLNMDAVANCLLDLD